MQALLEHFITQSVMYSLIAVALVALIRHPLMPVYGEILLKVVSR